MEKKDSKDLVNIKLTFLDLFPSFEEIDSNNEGITINFQDFSFSYDLSELIKTRDELLIPNQIPNQIIKVFLLKSGNIYATGPLTIKNGEQWVTFSYEHKKRTSTNLALSLIDCIKIKFVCKMDYITNNFEFDNDNNILTNTEMPNKLDNNILLKPSPKKLYSNLISKKKNGYISNKAGIIGDPLDSLHTEESKISKIFENHSSDHKHSEKNNDLNNTTLPSYKNQHKNPLIKSENLSEFCPLAASSGIVGKDFKFKDSNKNKNLKKSTNNNQKKKTNSKLSNDNINSKNKEIEKQKTNMNNSLNNNENAMNNSKQNSNLKRVRSKNLIDSKNKSIKKEKEKINKNNKDNKNQNANNSNMNHSSKKINQENSSKNMSSKNKEELYENYSYNSDNKYQKSNLFSQISNEIKEYSNKNKEDKILFKNDGNSNEIVSNFGFDNFSKKLEDFQLLYNDDYIKNIKEEDYSLEIELYIEKLMELIIEYHLQIEEKEIEYQLLKNIYHKNLHLLSEQNKLSKKLQLIIDDNNIKQASKISLNSPHRKNKINNLITNRNEVNIFNFIIFSQKDKDNKNNKEKLTKILKNILSKPKHKNIINQNEKIKKWANSHMDKVENAKDKNKKRINTGKLTKSQIDDKDKGKYNKKKKSINNSNNTPPKTKNKFNKK